jgi:hypothetical protein
MELIPLPVHVVLKVDLDLGRHLVIDVLTADARCCIMF